MSISFLRLVRGKHGSCSIKERRHIYISPRTRIVNASLKLIATLLILRAKSLPSPCLRLALILSSYQIVSSRPPPGISMTRHGYRGSTNRSTTYRRDHSGYSAVPSPVANDGCLSSRADFIPSWLNHLPNNPPQDIPQQKSPLDSNHLSWHPNGLTTVRIQPNCGTRRYQSPDILIQNSPSQSPLPDQRCHHQYRQSAPDSDHGQNLDDGERHRHPIQLASTTSEASPTKNHVFEKQPRRKTRRDRYDTIKSKIERTEKGQGKKSSARVSKKRRLPSSQEIMANFKSQAIANPGERITVLFHFIS